VAKVYSKDSQIEVHLHISYISYHRDMSKGIMMLEKRRRKSDKSSKKKKKIWAHFKKVKSVVQVITKGK